MRTQAAAIAIGFALAATPTAAKSPLSGCDAFTAALRADASELQVDFTHAIVVSRARSDENVFDITTSGDVDGVLTCRGDTLARFEARVVEPASARAATNFERLEQAALRAALGWDAAKAKAKARAMNADAKEYLRASRERGDVYISGKTEEHLPGGVSLGVIETDTDRAFVIVGADY